MRTQIQRALIVLGPVIIFLDQLTKYLIRSNVPLGHKIPVIGDWMNITYVQNRGVAFSMFSGHRWITIVLTAILICLCIYFIGKYIKASPFLALTLTCIAGGGISNLFDRIIYGYVVDMISCGSFAVFNVADMFVTCGCVACMIYILFYYKEKGDVNE